MYMNKELQLNTCLVTWLLLAVTCEAYKRALTDYATPSYAPDTSSPRTLLIPTGQENVAAALLRASLMFDEEGMQYPYYEYRHNNIEKIQEANYDMQNHGGGHIQYYYQPVYNRVGDYIYRTHSEADQIPHSGYIGQDAHYVTNNVGNDYDSQDDKDQGSVYIEPIQQTREEYSRAIAYQQYQPQVVTTSTINYQQLPVHIPSTPIYPTQATYNHQLFKPAEPAPTRTPSVDVDIPNESQLSTTKQQALLTQYFHNIQAQSEDKQGDESGPQEEKHQEEEDMEESRYKFGYRITDTVTGMEYGQAEAREGQTTRGHYHVLLPDGRMQHVHYWSDHTGYHASISYDDGPRQVIS